MRMENYYDKSRLVALFTRAWIEIILALRQVRRVCVALFTRAWIEIGVYYIYHLIPLSPSSRGRGLKFSAMSDATVTAILFKSMA